MTSAEQCHLFDQKIADIEAAPQPFNQKKHAPSARFDQRSADHDLDNALLLMAPEITDWLETNTQNLQGALATYLSIGGRPPRTLMHSLQDLRGQAGSIGFPLAGRVAACSKPKSLLPPMY
jgi:hypothetical protein